MEQWYPTREILRFGRVWSQKRRQSSTPQVPCVQCGRVRHRLWGTCNNRTMVPHKEIQWHNGTPQEKF